MSRYSIQLVFHLYNTLMILAGASLIALRSPDVGTDTTRYIRFLDDVKHAMSTRLDEPLFMLLAKLALVLGCGHPLFFFFISAINAIALYYFFIAAGRNSIGRPDRNMTMISLALLLTFISPLFWNFQTNILRAGLSVPFILLGAYSLHKRSHWRALSFLVIGVLFHSSSILFAAAAYLILLPISVVWFLLVVGSMLYLSGLGQVFMLVAIENMSQLVDLSYHLKYFTSTGDYHSGIRFDFYIFTLVFLVMSWFASKHDEFGFKAYSVFFMPFLWLGFISYSDRLLVYCWALIPFIIAQLLTFWLGQYNRVVRQIAIPGLLLPLCFYLFTTGAL